jgi:hypothetical protein
MTIGAGLVSWGLNYNSVPIPPPPRDVLHGGVAEVVATYNHAAFRLESGGVVHWGADYIGQPLHLPPPTVQLTIPGKAIASVAAGIMHLLVLTSDGSLYCYESLSPLEGCVALLGSGLAGSSGGGQVVHAIHTNYYASFVQLGTDSGGEWRAFGEIAPHFHPERMSAAERGRVRGIVESAVCVYVLLEGSEPPLTIWIENDAPLPPDLLPQPQPPLQPRAISQRTSLESKRLASVSPWGTEIQAEGVGGSSTSDDAIPGVRQVCTLLGAWRGNVALLANGSVIVWAALGEDVTALLPPADLPPNVTSIACGRDHVVATLADGSARAWGADARNRQTDIPLGGALQVQAVAAGFYHSAFLTQASHVTPLYLLSGSLPYSGHGLACASEYILLPTTCCRACQPQQVCRPRVILHACVNACTEDLCLS